MNYTEAVRLARAGEERGFGFLYQNTYKSKYYLALQYMKNEEAAEDVLQEAYIKAFSKLDTLGNPEAFPGWLGTIVANTAKNMLAKNNPMLFSDIAADEEDESFEYRIEDENVENQPEISYTRQETQTLVHELIDSLSEEQRMCILMFHIEGASISEIAAAMGCSENTVKSRLNYGRKNLKIKAEELQKKGYRLYSVAPVPLLLYLLRTDEAYLTSDGTLASAGELVADRIFYPDASQNGAERSGDGRSQREDESRGIQENRTHGEKRANAAKRMSAANRTGAANAAKTGFLHTAAGKAAAVVLGLCVSGGAVFGAVQLFRGEPEAVREENETEPETQREETSEPEEVRDAQYPALIAGNLTKEELEFVLAYGPEEIPEGGFQDSDYTYILNAMVQASAENGNPIEDYGVDENWRSQYSVEDVNRLFSSFTDYQFTEENDSDTEYGLNVEGNRLTFSPATINYSASAEITSAEYTEDEMDVFFTYVYTTYPTGNDDDEGTVTTEKKAVLKPDEEGMYRIVNIEESARDGAGKSETENDISDQEQVQGQRTVQEVYAKALRSVQNRESGYEFPNAGTQITGYQYFLCDIDSDGIEELIVGAEFQDGMNDQYILYDCRVFDCSRTDGGYVLEQINGSVIVSSLHIASDGNGLYAQELISGGTGQILVDRLTIQNGTFAAGTDPEYEFTLGDSEMQQFNNANPAVQWTDISDPSGLV